MKVVQINSVCGSGSTGKIAVEISKKLSQSNIENYIFYGIGTSDYPLSRKFGNNLNIKLHLLKTRLLGKHGFYSKMATIKLINVLNKIKPDIIQLHNIHGFYINIKMLFKYIKKNEIKVIWTLHDCWSFTGHCAHFLEVGCEKWKTGCFSCTGKKKYPISLLFDRSKWQYETKKELFLGVKDLTIVTPSKWLKDMVSKSFLQNYKTVVINNGVDLDVFRPYDSSDFETLNSLEGKFIVLGMANKWLSPVNSNLIYKVAEKMDKDTVIVLLGVDKTKNYQLPSNVIAIEKISEPTKLAKIYSAADVFVNTTMEDTFPTVNVEAIACGTPVITYDAGGSAEIINNETGIVVEVGNVYLLVEAINKIRICKKAFYTDTCVKRAKTLYEKNDKYQEYVSLLLSDTGDNIC